MYGGQISPEIYQLATSFHLGKPTVRFETLPRIVWNFHFSLYTLYTAVLVIWLCLFALLSYLLEFSRNMADIPSNYTYVFVIFWPVIWMMAIWCIIGYDIHVIYQHTCIYNCTIDLLGYNEYDRSVTAIPWDTIESVSLVISPIYIPPMDEENEKRGLKLDSWKYTFQCSNGKRVVFKGQSGIQSLRYVVEKEVKARLLPKAIATFESGLPVCFGDIEVSQEGIRIGQQAVAWKNILYVDMKLDRF